LPRSRRLDRLNLRGSSPARIKLPERAQDFGPPRRASCIRTDPGTGRHESSKRGSPPPGQRPPARPHRRETLQREQGNKNHGSTPPRETSKPRPTGPARHRKFLSPFRQNATVTHWVVFPSEVRQQSIAGGGNISRLRAEAIDTLRGSRRVARADARSGRPALWNAEGPSPRRVEADGRFICEPEGEPLFAKAAAAAGLEAQRSAADWKDEQRTARDQATVRHPRALPPSAAPSKAILRSQLAGRAIGRSLREGSGDAGTGAVTAVGLRYAGGEVLTDGDGQPRLYGYRGIHAFASRSGRALCRGPCRAPTPAPRCIRGAARL